MSGPTTTRRGFSLLDVLIALTLLAIVFSIGIRFVVSLAGASEDSLNRAAGRRQVELVRQALDADLSNLVPCTPNGIEPAVIYLNAPAGPAGAASLVVRTTSGTGTAKVVAWRVNGTTLERAELGAPARCDAALNFTDWTAYARNLTTGTGVFSALVNGRPSSYAGSCTGNAVTNCDFSGLRVQFTAEPVAGGGAVPFDATWSVPDAGARM
jgi:prepilin-type N-terminal cleavage/methylation domain-containing protein